MANYEKSMDEEMVTSPRATLEDDLRSLSSLDDQLDTLLTKRTQLVAVINERRNQLDEQFGYRQSWFAGLYAQHDKETDPANIPAPRAGW